MAGRESKPVLEFMRRFLAPLLSLKPSNVSTEDYFTQMLSVHSRPISGYRAKKHLTLDGNLCADEMPGRPDLSPDKNTLALIRRGELIWARMDDTVTWRVEVEHKGRLWEITKKFWDAYLRPGLAPAAEGQEEL